ncbi:MAG: GNAT family N-acetyltransferase [Gammaproteobacteria bacterium]|nr:MAG: GNAT family N-acetyltransferase [Gammaproteobacteria bacterium]
MSKSIYTPRLKLRQWHMSDLKPFAQMNADPEVMRYFPTVLTESDSNALGNKIQKLIDQKGYGFWGVELLATQEFIGFAGLNEIDSDSELAKTLNMDKNFLEIGWRLAKKYWGKGYASEAAKAVLDFAFNDLLAESVYAFTAVVNQPSQKVMQRLGMVNTKQNFNHPKVKQGHELERHCLYCINRDCRIELNLP